MTAPLPEPKLRPDSATQSVTAQDLETDLAYRRAEEWPYEEEFRRHRRLKLVPAVLFVLTLCSTFFVGICDWNPNALIDSLLQSNQPAPLLVLRKLVLDNWQQGLTYMFCVVLILLLHEMGHFIYTLIYRVPASFPIFLPFPINPIGTMGAVIAMHGMAANRRQIFDIGIAGPLVGLVAAVPIAYWGVAQLDMTTQALGGIGFRLPLIMQWFANITDVPGYEPGKSVWLSQLNPMFVAGWVGMLITGFNMMPIGQLDGGHVTYTLFGTRANLIARITITLIVAFMVYHQNYLLLVMVTLLLMVGTDHPPTRDETVRLDPFRYGLGLLSLTIPILCFPPLVFEINY
jgi:Zn-dependent protease